jgi:hypothetical protein
MKYFKNINSLEDLKKQFKKLAFKHHPDKGGDVEVMKAINNEYDILFPVWKNRDNIKTEETAESTRNEFYTQNGWKGEKYDRNLDIKTIAKFVREQLKEEFSDCKFSVTKNEFSGGCSLTVIVKETPKSVYANDDKNIINYEISPYIEYPELSIYGKKLVARVWEIINQYRYSDCDSQIDYFSVNFYPSLKLGNYDETVKVVERKVKKSKKTTEKNNKNNSDKFDIVENFEKNGIELYFEGKPSENFRNMLKQFGFKWNRNKKCWYTKRNSDTLIVLENLQNQYKLIG